MLPSPSKPSGRHHRDDPLGEKALEEAHVHPVHLPGEEVVDAVEDPQGVGDDGVGGGGAEVVGREPLEDLVRQAVGGREGEGQRLGVGDAAALEIGGREAPLAGELLDLGRGAVNEDDADAERPQHRHVHEEVAEVLVGDVGPVHRDDERLLAELRNVLQDAPQVGGSHSGPPPRRDYPRSGGVASHLPSVPGFGMPPHPPEIQTLLDGLDDAFLRQSWHGPNL